MSARSDLTRRQWMDRAYRDLDEFQRLAKDAPETVSELAAGNAAIVRKWIAMDHDLSDLYVNVANAERRLRDTTNDYRDVDAKLNQYGSTHTIGLLLRHKKEQLDRWRADDSGSVLAAKQLAGIREQQLALELVTDDGSMPTAQADERLIQSAIRFNDNQLTTVRSQLIRLYQQRYQWIVDLRAAYADYHHGVGALDSATTSFTELAGNYRRLIRRHVIWIRSGKALSTSDFGKLDDAAVALFASGRSDAIGMTIGRKWEANRSSVFAMIAWMAGLGFIRWRSKSWLLSIGRKKRLKAQSKRVRAATAAILTILTSACIPAMMYVISRWLGGGIVSTPTLHASSAAAAAALVALAIELPRQSLRTDGLIDRHVDIELPGRVRAVTYLTIIAMGLVLAAYVVTLGGLTDRGAWRDSFSRVGFIIAMLLVAWTGHRTLRVVGGFAEPLVAKFGGRVIHRVRFVLYLAAVAGPIALVALSIAGYDHTAHELLRRSLLTWVAALVGSMVWPALSTGSSHLWFLLTATEEAKRTHVESRKSDRLVEDDGRYGSTGYIEPVTEAGGRVTGVLASHFLELKHQLAFLCQCGLVMGGLLALGWLWMDVIPIANLGNPVLWTVTQEVAVADITGVGETQWISQPKSITAVHVLLAAATLFVAFQLAKLLPALFDALVLQRVSFDEAMEHFTFVLGRCLLFSVGLLIASRLLGLRWQTVQWLAVGLMVGLGFGMQDMVRNLLGGIIVLFEKPAKLGDRISVGKLTGRVAMQRLRTTILSDDEGREVIVPNKNFVSDEVVNWMGAGRLRAVPMEIAVHRDQRAADVCRTMTELMLEQPDVLISPAPQATLVCVAQSSQRIELRAWIEEGQSASQFRDKMLAIAKSQLRDAGLLAKLQPKQPSLQKESKVDEDWMRVA